MSDKDDCISRQMALDAFGLSEKTRKYGGDHSGYDTRMLYEIQDTLENLPAVQPDHTADIGKKVSISCGQENDLISRKAAIDALARMMPRSYTPDGSHPADEEIFRAQEIFADCIEALEILPSTNFTTKGILKSRVRKLPSAKTVLSEEDKVICKLYLDDLDSRKSCNEYKILMSLLDSTARESGHWIVWGGMDIPENHGRHKCSLCREFAPVRYEKPLVKEYLSDFCPNCGADMRKEGAE